MRGTSKGGAESIQLKGERKGSKTGRGNMLELIQLSAACRGSQYRDIVPVCGGSAERVADASSSRKEGGT